VEHYSRLTFAVFSISPSLSLEPIRLFWVIQLVSNFQRNRIEFYANDASLTYMQCHIASGNGFSTNFTLPHKPVNYAKLFVFIAIINFTAQSRSNCIIDFVSIIDYAEIGEKSGDEDTKRSEMRLWNRST
jgi:hypothetical protein